MTAIGLDRVLELVRGEFPGAGTPSEEDVEILEAQLGRPHRGDILVASRCPHGRPAVLLTVPFASSTGPTPPLLWLACPHAARGVGVLESEGAVSMMASRLDSDALVRSRLQSDEERLTRLVAGISVAASGPAAREAFRDRGIAWGRKGSVKCLHAHLAFALARGVPRGAGRSIGEWCAGVLEEREGVWCERIPATCLY